MKNCVRKINKNFTGLGRRFVKGDLIVIQENDMFHIYPQSEKEVETIKDDLVLINKNLVELILDNSEDI